MTVHVKATFWKELSNTKISPDLKNNNNPPGAENTDLQSQHPCNREVIQKQQIAFSG